jgi:hypothetical protein
MVPLSLATAVQLILYESDLDDNGISQCSVKLRVMPRAWLVLLRFFLRVDGSLVRLRETRVFCRCAAFVCVWVCARIACMRTEVTCISL